MVGPFSRGRSLLRRCVRAAAPHRSRGAPPEFGPATGCVSSGHADPAALVSWVGATASWPGRRDPGGTRGLDDHFTRDFRNNIGAEPHQALRQAKVAADGKDVRLGGLWESPDELLDRFHLEVVPSPSGVVHHLFWHR